MNGSRLTQAYMPQAATTDWATPKATFDALWDEFGPFDLDPCGQKETHYSAHKIVQHGGVCYDGSTSLLDGLINDWSGVVYMNPPYGRSVGDWCKKAVSEIVMGGLAGFPTTAPTRIVALLPAKTDTRWWHRYIQGRAHVEFLRGRLRFHGTPALAPFPSAVVVWGDMP